MKAAVGRMWGGTSSWFVFAICAVSLALLVLLVLLVVLVVLVLLVMLLVEMFLGLPYHRYGMDDGV